METNRKILIMGLPGAGKSTLARMLAPRLKAVLFNADEVRAHINRELGFSHADRIEHARRMGWMCDRVVEAGGWAIADFICPTPDTRAAFGAAYVIFVDRIRESRFEDTNRMFVPPAIFDFRVGAENSPSHWADEIFERLARPVLDRREPALDAGLVSRPNPGHGDEERWIAPAEQKLAACRRSSLAEEIRK